MIHVSATSTVVDKAAICGGTSKTLGVARRHQYTETVAVAVRITSIATLHNIYCPESWDMVTFRMLCRAAEVRLD